MKQHSDLAQKGLINENASIRDSHSIVINAKIEKVWDILINVERWPEWNADISKVQIDGKPEIGKDCQWNFNRTRIKSQFQAIEEPKLISWSGKTRWVKEIYVWQMESDENQTIITLSASLQGFLVTLVNNHQKVYNELINWLEALKKRAEEG